MKRIGYIRDSHVEDALNQDFTYSLRPSPWRGQGSLDRSWSLDADARPLGRCDFRYGAGMQPNARGE